MQKSRIEWTESTANPVKGKCPVDCSYCYVKPFRKRYGWHEDIRFYPEELEAIRKRKKPTRIFVGSTIELFHEQTIQYMPAIMETVKACPQHTFMFLTKQPQNLASYSPFPNNCWVGVSATNQIQFDNAIKYLKNIKATVKFLSIEPLLEHIDLTSYIGYNKPLYKECDNVTKKQRGNTLPSDTPGGIGDRRTRSNMESQGQNRDTLGEGITGKALPEAESRPRFREILSSPHDGQLEKDILPLPSSSVEILSRPNSRRYDNQPQEREQEGQPASKLGGSNILSEYQTHDRCTTNRPCPESIRNEEPYGKANRGSIAGNKGSIRPNNSRNEDEAWKQDKRIGSEISGELQDDMGSCERLHLQGISLVIIGAQTKPTVMPKIQWVQSIVDAADNDGCKVWLKDSLNPLFEGKPSQDMKDMRFTMKHPTLSSALGIRQEMPE